GFAPPAEGCVLVLPLRDRHDLAVVGGVALEGAEAGPGAGEALHLRGVGGIGRDVEVGALAVAEDDEEHGAAIAPDGVSAKAVPSPDLTIRCRQEVPAFAGTRDICEKVRQ